MTSAPPIAPVTYGTTSGTVSRFFTSGDIERYARDALSHSAVIERMGGGRQPGLLPTVTVGQRGTGEWEVCVSITGEGFGEPVKVVRLYPPDSLSDEYLVRSAVWSQYADALEILSRSIGTHTED